MKFAHTPAESGIKGGVFDPSPESEKHPTFEKKRAWQIRVAVKYSLIFRTVLVAGTWHAMPAAAAAVVESLEKPAYASSVLYLLGGIHTAAVLWLIGSYLEAQTNTIVYLHHFHLTVRLTHLSVIDQHSSIYFINQIRMTLIMEVFNNTRRIIWIYLDDDTQAMK
ncbi:hypothetical protein ACJX0J_021720 [Zea mays]